MFTIFRCCTLLLILVACQACSTSGGVASSGSSTADTLGATSTGSVRAGSIGGGNMVPAIVGIPSDPGPDTTYRIGVHDLLKVDVFQVEELSTEERVNDEGLITMPLIGNIKVGGLTPSEAEHAIERMLGQNYLQEPQVSIFVVEYANQDVTVTGSVRSPGVYALKGRTTLLQAIALAGGFNDIANEEEVVVFRQQAGGTVNAYVVNVDAISDGTLTDPTIVGDDRVVVPESGKDVFMKGAGTVLRSWILRIPIY